MTSSLTDRLDVREHRRRALLPGGVGRSLNAVGDRAVYAVRADGPHIVDGQGRELIDLNNNMTANLHGNAHPTIVTAVKERMDQGMVSVGVSNDDELDLAELLTTRIPWAEQVRFTNSGTEAVMLATRVARARTDRDLILAMTPGYHGWSDVVLPSTGDRGRAGLPRAVDGLTLAIPRGDLAELERAFDLYGPRIAAVVVDLCASGAGLTALSQDFVAAVQDRARTAGALTIVDEVVTFRVGLEGLIQSYDGFVPDMMTLGKVIGGGFPVGALVGTADALSPLDHRRHNNVLHGGTFSANPLTMVAGRVTLEMFDQPAISRVNRLGELFAEEVTAQLDENIWSLRRCGSVLRLYPAGWNVAQRRRVQSDLYWAAYDEGLLISESGLSCLSTVMDENVTRLAAQHLVAAAQAVQLATHPA